MPGAESARGEQPEKCPTCDGTGIETLPYIVGVANVTLTCRRCKATGEQPDRRRRFADRDSGTPAACAQGHHAWVEQNSGALECEVCGKYSGCLACEAERDGVPNVAEWTHVGGCGDAE